MDREWCTFKCLYFVTFKFNLSQRHITNMIGAACNSRLPQAKEGGSLLQTGGSLYSSLHQKWVKLGALLQRMSIRKIMKKIFKIFDSAPSYFMTLYDSVFCWTPFPFTILSFFHPRSRQRPALRLCPQKLTFPLAVLWIRITLMKIRMRFNLSP